jgi:Protein of unknown function (DUF2865)
MYSAAKNAFEGSTSSITSLKTNEKSLPAASPVWRSGGIGRRTIAAFALGAAFVSSAVYTMGGDLSRAFAKDDAGMHDFLMQNQHRQPFYKAPVFYTPAYRAPVVYRQPSIFNFGAPQENLRAQQPQDIFQANPDALRKRALRGFADLPRNIAPLRQRGWNQPRALPGALDDAPAYVDASGLPRRSFCVRLCDGYYFPVAPVGSEGDLNAHESLCSGLCPGAPTKLYIMPGGSERIEEAMSRDGHKYSALPVAFRHTGTSDNTCACRPDNIAHTKIVSVMKDFTLRQGDMVMTNKGFRVFRGSMHYPYGQSDFMSLAESGINSKNRAALSAIESAMKRATARPLELAPTKPEKSASARPVDAVLTDSAGPAPTSGKPIRRIGPQVYLGE